MGKAALSLPGRLLVRLGLATLVCFAPAASQIQAQNAKPTQYDVEAAYLYQFGRFVEWPPQDGAPKQSEFAICVLGRDPFGKLLDATVKGEQINGLPLTVRRLGSAQEATACRVLFISSSEQTDLPLVLGALRQASILTVSDIPDFASRGGMIQFVLMENKIRFQVNLGNAERAGLMLSSQLLKVATSVQQDAGPEKK